MLALAKLLCRASVSLLWLVGNLPSMLAKTIDHLIVPCESLVPASFSCLIKTKHTQIPSLFLLDGAQLMDTHLLTPAQIDDCTLWAPRTVQHRVLQKRKATKAVLDGALAFGMSQVSQCHGWLLVWEILTWLENQIWVRAVQNPQAAC